MPSAKKPRRKALTKALQRKVFLEAGTQCPWCESPLADGEAEIHHIDGDRTNNVLLNLLLVCRNHHGQIESQLIPHWEVMLKKTMLCNPGTLERLGLAKKTPPANNPTVVAGDNHGVAGQTVNIKEAHFHDKKKRGRRENSPGLIESDPDMRTYANELVGRYIEFRIKGEPIENSKKRKTHRPERPFSPPAAHTILGKDFGSKRSVLLIPQSRFHDWVKFAQARIDGTTLGRINNGKGYPNYHSWDEHLRRRHG